jgi:hypothetical protein
MRLEWVPTGVTLALLYNWSDADLLEEVTAWVQRFPTLSDVTKEEQLFYDTVKSLL